MKKRIKFTNISRQILNYTITKKKNKELSLKGKLMSSLLSLFPGLLDRFTCLTRSTTKNNSEGKQSTPKKKKIWWNAGKICPVLSGIPANLLNKWLIYWTQEKILTKDILNLNKFRISKTYRDNLQSHLRRKKHNGNQLRQFSSISLATNLLPKKLSLCKKNQSKP